MDRERQPRQERSDDVIPVAGSRRDDIDRSNVPDYLPQVGEVIRRGERDLVEVTERQERPIWKAEAMSGLAPELEAISQNLTFLFTDVEGSTAMWERDAGLADQRIGMAHSTVRTEISRRGGELVLEQGAGDSLVAAFATVAEGVRAAVDSQMAVGPSRRRRADPHGGSHRRRAAAP